MFLQVLLDSLQHSHESDGKDEREPVRYEITRTLCVLKVVASPVALFQHNTVRYWRSVGHMGSQGDPQLVPPPPTHWQLEEVCFIRKASWNAAERLRIAIRCVTFGISA